MIKVFFKPEILDELDEVLLTKIAGMCGIGYTSLYRWYKNNDTRMTQYAIIWAISKVLDKPIEEIITIENA